MTHSSLMGGPQSSSEATPAVLLRDVVFSWTKEQGVTLDIPHFSVATGEQVFISGPSGSGKSTLLGLIAGILSPDSGTVSINGTRLSQLGSAGRDAFRGDHIGYIFQQFNLIPYLSILENVLMACRFSRARHSRSCIQAVSPKAEACSLLDRLGLPASLWDRPANKLSVGQQQRVAAARALIGKPSVLIADEPTSSLDADRRKIFLQLLLEECRLAGAALLFVSHDQSLSEDFSTRVQLHKLNRAFVEQVQ